MAKDSNRIINIGKSIRHQHELERSNRGQQLAVARFDVEMTSPNGERLTHLWLAGGSYIPGSRPVNGIKKEEGSAYFNKNSAVGTLITSRPFGSYKYQAPDRYRKGVLVERELSFSSRATYSTGSSIRNLNILIQGEPGRQFATLDDVLKKVDELERQLEAKRKEQEERERQAKKLEEEKIAREAALAKAKAEEAERLRKEQEAAIAEQKRQEEIRQRELEEIRKLEEEQTRALELIEQTNNSFRSGFEMRYQEIPDVSQTQAKISHIYDGIPIVIDGGPGTGKTTTSIQRLKFLIDPYLAEQEACKLTETQVNILTNPDEVSSHWIFISPSELLAQYLKSALSAEGLANDIRNVTPFENFRLTRLQDYYISQSQSDGKAPFRPIQSRKNPALYHAVLISDGRKAVEAFEDFLIQRLGKAFRRALEIDIAGFDWRISASNIQRYCGEVEGIKRPVDLVKLFVRIQEAEANNVKEYNERLKSAVERMANRIRKAVMTDEETVEYLSMLFDEWAKAGAVASDTDDTDFSEEEDPQIDIEGVDGKVYQNLKTLLRKLALRQIDKSIELSKRQKEFNEWVAKFIEDEDLTEIANLAWFNRNFASLCRGLESNVLTQIIKLYKAFRNEQLKVENPVFDTVLLKQIVSTSENRFLHPDEQSLLLGFINNLMRDILRWSRMRFNALKHPYAQAYKRSVKYVIGVDEASDYSILDYYCIASFAHYDFSAITLCGDIMQGLGSNGISAWNDLKKWIFPKLDIFTLRKSYRQWPTLLEVSRRMYQDDLGTPAPYETALVKRLEEPAPAAFISNSEDAKINWIAKQIEKVHSRFGELPSIAIFINEGEDATEFVRRLQDIEIMDRYIIENCTDGKQGREDSIRVFYLSKVKGMEFEAAYFHNIDCAKIENAELLRRYLYVGISRAVSHLGATFMSADSDVLKYFEVNQD